MANGPAEWEGRELLTVTETAERLQISPETVRNLIRRGQLKGYRRPFGRKLFVDAESVRELNRFEEYRPDAE